MLTRKALFLSAILSSTVMAKTLKVELKTTQNHTPIGSIQFEDTPYGLLIKPNLSSMNPGMHGLHIHQNASCAKSGQAAGGHLDPKHTGKHLGPFQAGHLGDLPVLYADSSGSSTQMILAPRLKVKQLLGSAVMIHEGGDNYSDKPLPMGGGGERFACGVIAKQQR